MNTPEDSPASQGRPQQASFEHIEIEMLHDLLLEWCSDHNVSPDGADAHEVARELADLFDIGVRDYLTLREAIASR